MMNQTSLESYTQSLKQLGYKQKIILSVLSSPHTNKEISKRLGWPINSVTGRVKELREKELVWIYGYKKDLETNRRVCIWKKK